MLIDTVLRGYAIYSIYGLSIHLLGSLRNLVTQLLLHLGQRKPEKPQPYKRKSKKENTTENLDPIYDHVEGRSIILEVEWTALRKI